MYVRPCIRTAFLKYALQAKGQLGYVSFGHLGQLVLIGTNKVQMGFNQGQVGSRGTKMGWVRTDYKSSGL
jgi:hypothetical protein